MSATRQLSWLIFCFAVIGCNSAEKTGANQNAPKPISQKTEMGPKESQTGTNIGPAFTVDSDKSDIHFTMDAPLEKIYGDLSKAASGEVQFDASVPERFRGTVRIDLTHLVLSQQKRDSLDQPLGPRVVNSKQNEHMRQWLEIGSDVPEEVLKKNRIATFDIETFAEPRTLNGTAPTNGSWQLKGTVEGALNLHGHIERKRVAVELTVLFRDGKAIQISGRNTEPLNISLDAHGVVPRETFGKLAKATLESLGQKVTQIVPLELHLVANYKP
jgi:hypothetical protein